MKSLLIKLTVVVLALQLTCCGDRNYSRYTLQLPEPPKEWVQLLGEPHWRVEWLSPDGQKQSKDISHGETIEVEIPATWASPVAAYPWWSSHSLIPGLFKPAGALFPHDISGNQLHLTWEAGVSAVFYFELAYANRQNAAKIPANFDWVRFRELLKTEIQNEAVCNDPWLVDWKFVAEKTIDSSFDRRRLVPQTTESINIPVPAAAWYGTSPFAEPLIFKETEPPVFQIHSGLNAWVCSKGVLRCSGKIWIFKPFD